MVKLMNQLHSVLLKCPHCKGTCQFTQECSPRFCAAGRFFHIGFYCTHCNGMVTTEWFAAKTDVMEFQRYLSNKSPLDQQLLHAYHPSMGEWNPKVKLSLITNNEVKADFKEAIDCYNSGFYNACMIMARRSVQQEVLAKGAKDDNLYAQINSTGISDKLKELLQKIKNFGNYGAHPDFFLYDEEGNKIEGSKEMAKLSLEFLDMYFLHAYKIDALIQGSPKSEKELATSG